MSHAHLKALLYTIILVKVDSYLKDGPCKYEVLTCIMYVPLSSSCKKLLLYSSNKEELVMSKPLHTLLDVIPTGSLVILEYCNSV